MRNLIAAIDIGTSKSVCLVGEKINGSLNIVSFFQTGSTGVSHGEVRNIMKVEETIKPIIKQAEEKLGMKINEVFINASGMSIKCENKTATAVRLKPEELISQQEIDNLDNEQYESYIENGVVINVIPQSYNIDNIMGEIDPVGMLGKQITANYKILTAGKAPITLGKQIIKRLGLSCRGIFTSALASMNAILTEEEKELGAVLVDMGAGTTDIAIIKRNIVRYVSVIPFGGNAVTSDISACCNLSNRNAELLKKQFGSCNSASMEDNDTIRIPGTNGREEKNISSKFLAEIIEARIYEIFEAVDYEIKSTGLGQKLKGGMILTGGCSYLSGINYCASSKTGMECRIAYPVFPLTQTSSEEIGSPAMSTAAGLVKMGFAKMEKEGTVYPTATFLQKDNEEVPEDLFSSNENPEKEKSSGEGKAKRKKGSFFANLKKNLFGNDINNNKA
ncbi:MAG: cell division protein FtsA [Bacteroidales bacterium]|jgi:cell division protein FtsA|nr:cell division protein FtsA [Bacteroidales bacterium]